MSSSGVYGLLLGVLLQPAFANAIDVPATATALRMSSTITGGLLSPADPIFTQMVTKIQGNDLVGAATLAANSKYAANYLYRRLAKQMQSPALDASQVTENDATAFLIAHFAGTATSMPSISTIWSENATYTVSPTAGAAAVHAADIRAADLPGLDWSAGLVRTNGQQVFDPAGAKITLPTQHVGGYVTLSDRPNDNSFAMYGATAGTNLRMIEGIWQISTGLSLVSVSSSDALAQNVPRFVPEYDPNFFHGQGQAACISCHGGGMASVNHGYAAVADVFDFAEKGFTYIAAPATRTMKSLGSDPNKRQATLTCDLRRTPTPVCNPDSVGVGTTNAWNVADTWQASGVLSTMGWVGATAGQGLNELGVALGKAKIVYQFLTKRVINEICPMGIFSDEKVNQIAKAANPHAQPAGTDDLRTIVAMVAADNSCQ